MQPATKPSARLDQIDREHFEEMLASASFDLLRSRISVELVRALADCESQADPMAVHRAQGAAKALRVVLELPGMLLKEMSAKTGRA
jgi:hypothetical protein